VHVKSSICDFQLVSSDSLVIGDPAIGDLLMIESVISGARRANP
jgi:hypothetical protein